MTPTIKAYCYLQSLEADRVIEILDVVPNRIQIRELVDGAKPILASYCQAMWDVGVV